MSARQLQRLYNELVKIASSNSGRTNPLISRFALAISGGVDSMALAVLCSRLQRGHQDLAFTAFVVDHKSRPQSKQDAEQTVCRLKQLGLSAFSLDIQWTGVKSPAELSNFETLARKFRYQALGEACMKHNLDKLLTAHHLDDQVETCLLAIATGGSGQSVSLIQSESRVPECWGLHGVHESGQFEQVERQRWAARHRSMERKNSTKVDEQDSAKQIHVKSSRPKIERGSQRLCKPLLEWHKADLIRICKSANIGWQEDETNLDPTQTPRNTVRRLLRERRLPLALREASLEAIIKRTREKANHADQQSTFVVQCCEVVHLDIRSGKLKVRMATRLGLSKHREMLSSVSLKRFVAARVWESFLDLVTPKEKVGLQGLGAVAAATFEDFQELPLEKNSERALHRPGHRYHERHPSFTTSGVKMERLKQLQVSSRQSSSNTSRAPDLLPADESHVWVLCRQPYSLQIPELNYPPRVLLDGTKASDSSELPPSLLDELAGWSSWHLWDGRYWIRIKNLGTSNLTVRPLQSQHMTKLKTRMDAARHRRLSAILKEAAPGKIRWTLPAIAMRGQYGTSAEEEIVVALPSLGRTGDFSNLYGIERCKMDWEIRYKAFSLPSNTFNHNPGDSGSKLPTTTNDTSVVRTWEHH